MPILFQVLIIQAIVITIIVLVLKHVLNGMLLDIALKKLTYLEYEKRSDVPLQFIVTSHKELSPAHKDTIRKILSKNFSTAQVLFHPDKKIMGGLIIKYDQSTIDCSLRTRLKEGGFIK